MKHYTKEELSSGYCNFCETHVDDLVAERKICVECLKIIEPEETTDSEQDDTDDDW